MAPYQYKNSVAKPGEDKFDASVVTPLSTTPLKAVLTFEGGQLTGLYMTLEESSSMLERVSKQIAEKYGPGQVNDSRKEEQCIYKNGSNFKITSGSVNTKWVEQLSSIDRIETTLTDIAIATCPASLRYGSIDPITLRSLSIRKLNASVEAKPKNLFERRLSFTSGPGRTDRPAARIRLDVFRRPSSRVKAAISSGESQP